MKAKQQALSSSDCCVAFPLGDMGLSAICKIVVFPDHTHLLFLAGLLSSDYLWVVRFFLCSLFHHSVFYHRKLI